MKPQKVAIVGGGIIGLYLAWKLSDQGHQVTVFEKKGQIGKEACSGLFSQRILKFVPESQNLVQNQIESVLIHFPKKTIKVKFSQPFLLMSHAELDRQVFEMARKAGARIVLGNLVDSLPEGFDRVIGCDGARSCVRKSLGLKETSLRLGIQGFVRQNDNANFVETWAVRGGFIWKIPRGNEIEYGIIAKPQEAQKLFQEFLKKNKIQIERTVSAMIPQGFLIPKNHTVTLCGDAAGLTKPWSGGGVVWGLLAADILLKNFPDFLKYRKAARKSFLCRIVFSKIATRLAYILGFKIPWLLPKSVTIEGDNLFSKK